MTTTQERILADGDGDDYFKQGAQDAEFFANNARLSNVLDVNRGIGQEIRGRRQTIAPIVGPLTVRHEFPTLLSPN